MRLSVVVPTRNEADNIGRCVESIRSNTVQPHEILVVDGLSTDSTFGIAKSLGVEVHHNPARHAAGARNVGIREATGDVVVFTDADCVPRSDWLAEIRRAFETDAELTGLGGPIVASVPRTRIERFFGNVFLQEIMPFPQETLLIRRRVFRGAFLTGNCSYRRDLLLSLGGFDEWFGNNAEDIDLFWRAIDSGAKLLYHPAVVVSHPFPATINEMIRNNFRNGISSTKLQKRYGSRFQIDKKLYRALFSHVIALASGRDDAYLHCAQIASHLHGKYYGSLRIGVINL